MSVEAGIEYWNKLTTQELEDCRKSLQEDLESGATRNGDTAQWIGEINTVLESRKSQVAS
jgi:hypothetical protein